MEQEIKQKKEKKGQNLYSVCTIWKANKVRTHSFFIVLFYDDKYVFIHFYVQHIVRNKNKLAFNDLPLSLSTYKEFIMTRIIPIDETEWMNAYEWIIHKR